MDDYRDQCDFEYAVPAKEDRGIVWLMLCTALAVLGVLIGMAALAHAESVSMTIEQAAAAMTALGSLDGYEKAVKDGATEKVIKARYVFSPGVIMAMAKDIAALKAVVQTAQGTQMKLRDEIAPDGGKIEPNSPEEAKYNKQSRELMALTVPVELTRLKWADLKLDPPDSNPIPAVVLSALLPLIDEGDKAK